MKILFDFKQSNHDNNKENMKSVVVLMLILVISVVFFCSNQTLPFTCKKWKCKFSHKWKYFFVVVVTFKKNVKLPFDTKHFSRFSVQFIIYFVLSIKVRKEAKGSKRMKKNMERDNFLAMCFELKINLYFFLFLCWL